MVKKSLLALLGVCAAGGGIGTYAAKYSSGKDKSKGGVAVDSGGKEQDPQKQKQSQPAEKPKTNSPPKTNAGTKPETKTKTDAAPKQVIKGPEQNPPSGNASKPATTKPGEIKQSQPQGPKPAQEEPKDFKKIVATWSYSSSLTNTPPTIIVTVTKDTSVSWICNVRWKLPANGMPDFSEANNKALQMENKLTKDEIDVNARKSFIKNCTDGKLQGEEDIVTSSSNEILLESQKNASGQYILKDLEKVYSEEFSKGMIRLATEDYKILAADDWTMVIEGDKDKKITFGSTSNSWQCTAEAKNTSGDLDDTWKNKFTNDVLKEKISETDFGKKKKYLLKNCLDNNNAIKLVGSGEAALTKESIETSLTSKNHKNPK